MTVLNVVSDSFNRANSGTLGTADSGQAWTNTQGAWGVTTNKAVASGVGVGNLAVIPGVGASDMMVSATFASFDGSNTTGLMARCSDLFANAAGGGTAYWGLALSSPSLFIYRSVNGTNTQLATTSVTPGPVLTLICTGTSIILQNNGTTVLSVTDSVITTGANAGLFKFSTSSGTTVDDFTVQAVQPQPRRLYQAVRRASVY